ncbi:MAG: hypothetical protein RIS70_2115, partial [Planctomycetota bacterium]
MAGLGSCLLPALDGALELKLKTFFSRSQMSPTDLLRKVRRLSHGCG